MLDTNTKYKNTYYLTDWKIKATIIICDSIISEFEGYINYVKVYSKKYKLYLQIVHQKIEDRLWGGDISEI